MKIILLFVALIGAALISAPAYAHRRPLDVRPQILRADMIVAEAELNGVPPRVGLAIVRIESGGRCNPPARHAAKGIMQVLPQTARSMGVAGRLTDCRTGLRAGMRYLSAIIHAHGVSCAALSLYNRGIGARPRCTAYGRLAMRFASQGAA